MPARGVEHPLALAEDMRQGLLDVDVLAGGARHDGHQRVPVVGRRDDDGVDVRPVEHPAEVVEGAPAALPAVATPSSRRSSETSQIPAISQSACAWKSSRCRRPIRPMPMKPTRTRSLAPATRLDEAAVASAVPARPFRNARRWGICRNLQSGNRISPSQVKLLLSTTVFSRRDFLARAAAVAATSARGARAQPAPGAPASHRPTSRRRPGCGWRVLRHARPPPPARRCRFTPRRLPSSATERRFVLVTVDLLGVTAAMRQRIGATLSRTHHLETEAWMLAASHTHCGPVVDDQLSVAYDLDDAQRSAIAAYTASLESTIAAAGRRRARTARAGRRWRLARAARHSAPTGELSSCRPARWTRPCRSCA